MKIIDNQNPSTLAFLEAEVNDLRLSCLSSSSKYRVEENAWGGSWIGTPDHLGGETDTRALADGEGEKLDRDAGWIIASRLGDLDISFVEVCAGSCNGNLEECFKSCIFFRFSTTVPIVGLSDGSIWRHLCAMLAIVLAALEGNRPLSWGSMIIDKRWLSDRKGLLHFTKFLSSLGWRLSRFFLPVSSSRRKIPKLHTLLFGVSNPFSSVSMDRFPTAWALLYSWTWWMRTKIMEEIFMINTTKNVRGY